MNSKAEGQLALSIDIDWAPDVAIDFLAQMLVERGVKATWFVTHESPAVQRLAAQRELFELGIHPNFLPGSSHGKTTTEVLEHSLGLAPGATTMRTHALVQSTPLLVEVMNNSPILVDSSLLVWGAPDVRPFVFEWEGKRLVRLPYIWEDDVELSRAEPSWDLEAFLAPLQPGGLKIFDFHPVTVYMNSASIESYQALKAASPELQRASKETLDSLVHEGKGESSLLEALLEKMAAQGGGRMLREIGQEWI